MNKWHDWSSVKMRERESGGVKGYSDKIEEEFIVWNPSNNFWKFWDTVSL